ncbi:uncharacterized oxidoreductase YjmC [Anabrus simplex]|uniref:uncharacterized oxidoreductase YjmC n=1 Tax=Anabrus simplex TaxID=316456 RepID=UPI0035A32C53
MDMATSNVAVGKIEVHMKKKLPIPLGWAVDETGKSTTNASEAFKIQRLMPMGGVLAGEKGYGLAILVEILSSMLADSLYGPHIRKWMTNDIPANLSQGFGCVNPECFAPGFQERLKALMDCMRNLEPMDPKSPVQVPGDFERNNMKKADSLGGVPYDTVLMDKMRALAEKIGVEPMKAFESPKKEKDK